MSVAVETTLGVIVVDLYAEARPKLCRNFLKLCKLKLYNLCLFHNVQAGFLAQTGDPTGTGRGGESVYGRIYGDQARFLHGDEGDEGPTKIRHDRRGLVSMAAAGDGVFGSQFFVTLGADGLTDLDARHAVIGEVAEGDHVLDRLNAVVADEEHRPYQDVRVTHTVVLEDPFEDPERLGSPPPSPQPDAAMSAGRLGAEEDVTDDSDVDQEAAEEDRAVKEDKARAVILEMVGDLPEADCAPPENVLFVCKLNPVTTDEDLEIIFGRFGKVVSCEVIRDRKSGESLQYAFVEFDNPKACEQAYFKMDNVLIDDRRIHVDFSQSVSTFRWKGKGRLETFEEGKKVSGFHKRRSNEQQRNYRKPASSRSPSPPEQSRGRRRRSPSPPQRARSPVAGKKQEDQRRLKENQRKPSSEDERKARKKEKKRRRSVSSEDERRKKKTGSNGRRRNSPSSEDERRKKKKGKNRSRSREQKQRRRSRSDEGRKRKRRSRSRERGSYRR